jgi:hypothetical protein
VDLSLFNHPQAVPALPRKQDAGEGSYDVNSDLEIKNPRVGIAIDRDKARAMGVSARTLDPNIDSFLAGIGGGPNWLAHNRIVTRRCRCRACPRLRTLQMWLGCRPAPRLRPLH